MTTKYICLDNLADYNNKIKNYINNKVEIEAIARANAISSLNTDLTDTNAAVSNNGYVKVELKEEAGIITSLIVTDSDIASANALSNLRDAVGISTLVEGENSHEARLDILEGADTVEGSVAKALKDAKDYTDEKDSAMDTRVDKLEATHAINSINNEFKTVAEEVTEGIANLNITVFDGQDTANSTTVEDGSHIAIKIVETDGKLDNVRILENNIANASDLNDLKTIVGYSANKLSLGTDAESRTVAARLTDAETALAKLDGTVDTDGSIKKQIQAAITNLINGAPNALDTLKEIADWIANQGTVEGEDGQVVDTASLVARVDENTKTIGTKAVEEVKDSNGNVTTEAVVATGLFKYVDDSINAEKIARENVISNLDKDLTGNNATTSNDKHVTVGIKEEDGIITNLTVATSDIASANDLIELTGVVGNASQKAVGTEGQEGYIAPVSATGLTARIESLESAVGEGGPVSSQISSAISDLNSTTSQEADEDNPISISITQTDGKLTSVSASIDEATDEEINNIFSNSNT